MGAKASCNALVQRNGIPQTARLSCTTTSSSQVRFLGKDEAVEPFSASERATSRTAASGMFVRTEDRWRIGDWLDLEWGREGGGEMVRALLELDAAGRRRSAFTGSTSRPCAKSRTASMSVIEAIGDSPEGTAESGDTCLDIDWMTRVRAQAAAARPRVVPALREPRRLSFEHATGSGLWPSSTSRRRRTRGATSRWSPS